MDEVGTTKADDVRVGEVSVSSTTPEMHQVVEEKKVREEAKVESAEEDKEQAQEVLEMHREVQVREEQVQFAQEEVRVQEIEKEAQEEVNAREEVKFEEDVKVREIAKEEVQKKSKSPRGAEEKEQVEVRVQGSAEVKGREEVKVFDSAEVTARESTDIKETIVGKNQSVNNRNLKPASKRASNTRSVLARTSIAKKPEPPRTQRAIPSRNVQGSLRPATPIKAKIATPVLRNTTNTVRTARIAAAPKTSHPAFGTSTTMRKVPPTSPKNAVAQAPSVVRSPFTKRTQAAPAKGMNNHPKNESLRTSITPASVTSPKPIAASSLRMSKVTPMAGPASSKLATTCKVSVPASSMKDSAPAKVLAAARVLKTAVSTNSIKTRLSTAGKSLIRTTSKVSIKNITA